MWKVKKWKYGTWPIDPEKVRFSTNRSIMAKRHATLNVRGGQLEQLQVLAIVKCKNNRDSNRKTARPSDQLVRLKRVKRVKRVVKSVGGITCTHSVTACNRAAGQHMTIISQNTPLCGGQESSITSESLTLMLMYRSPVNKIKRRRCTGPLATLPRIILRADLHVKLVALGARPWLIVGGANRWPSTLVFMVKLSRLKVWFFAPPAQKRIKWLKHAMYALTANLSTHPTSRMTSPAILTSSPVTFPHKLHALNTNIRTSENIFSSFLWKNSKIMDFHSFSHYLDYLPAK